MLLIYIIFYLFLFELSFQTQATLIEWVSYTLSFYLLFTIIIWWNKYILLLKKKMLMNEENSVKWKLKVLLSFFVFIDKKIHFNNNG